MYNYINKETEKRKTVRDANWDGMGQKAMAKHKKKEKRENEKGREIQNERVKMSVCRPILKTPRKSFAIPWNDATHATYRERAFVKLKHAYNLIHIHGVLVFLFKTHSRMA